MNSPLLMSKVNPTGWKLEELFEKIVTEITELKNPLIAADKRMEARTVLQNNQAICGLLREAKRRQEHSMEVLATLGPNQGPGGVPRVGVGSTDHEETR